MSALILLPLVAIPAGVLAFELLKNHKAKVALTASTCGTIPHPGGTLDPSAIFIGPDLSHLGPPPEWGNKSPGCPAHPRPLASGAPGFEVDVPVGVDLPLGTGDKLDSMAFNHGPLTGKKEIVLTIEVIPSEPDAELLAVPEQEPTARYRARITVYIQRALDNWTTQGVYEAYRWYYDQDVYLTPGVTTLTIPLDPVQPWGGTQTSTLNPDDKGGFNPDGSAKAKYNPQGFKEAIDNCLAVGFGFGGNEIGRIHGMRATKPVVIRVTKFEVN